MDTTPRPKYLDNRQVDTVDRWSTWQTQGLPELIRDELELGLTHSPAAAARVEELADDLAAELERSVAHLAVDRWVARAETWEERLDRRATVATLERLSGLRFTPLGWPGWQPPLDVPRKRVMTELEEGLLRLHVQAYDLRRVATMGLLEAGLNSGELPLIAPCDIEGAHVHAPGHKRLSARVLTLSAWARKSIDALCSSVPAKAPLVYTGRQRNPDRAVSTVLMNFNKPFVQSGLAADPTLAPMSVTNTGLRRIYDNQGWEACVEAAGVADWQRLRRRIGLA